MSNISKLNKKKREYNLKYPFVSICTPTFNRRPFFPFIIKCFENQTYPKNRMEWIIIDDGTDKIEDLVLHIPQIKYFKYNEKMFLGKKRNLMHEKSSGDIIVYMDDDDYYPPERVSHAVETLQNNPSALCAGSSEMHIFFKHINKMYKFGPYGPNHSTAATFAFKKELLLQTKYDDNAALAEERNFLKGYTIPFVQLDITKSILVISHNHNSFDKKNLLNNPSDKYVTLSTKTVDDFITEKDLKQFFINDIDKLLNNYEPGKPEYKPDVLKQIEEIKIQREQMVIDHNKKQIENQNMMNTINKLFPNNDINQMLLNYQNKMNEMNVIIHELTIENNMLKEKTKYLENKITTLIQKNIQEKKQNIIPINGYTS